MSIQWRPFLLLLLGKSFLFFFFVSVKIDLRRYVNVTLGKKIFSQMDDMSSIMSFRVISRTSEGQAFFLMKIYVNRFFCHLSTSVMRPKFLNRKKKQLKSSMNILYTNIRHRPQSFAGPHILSKSVILMFVHENPHIGEKG